MPRGSSNLRKASAPRRPLGNVVVVLMAGGAGVRFWPVGTPRIPKQFLTALTGRSLFAETVERAHLLVPWERILVLTHADYCDHVREQAPECPAENVVLEPLRRDTAAATVLAAAVVNARWPGSVMVVMPSDHMITGLSEFRRTLAVAAARARRGGLGTLGIPPTCPATGYGYLRLAKAPEPGKAARVAEFVEKPPAHVAQEYVASGRFLWNSGMFVWKTGAFLEAAARHLPEHCRHLVPLGGVTGKPDFPARAREAFEKIQPVSVDYGILEKAGHVWTVPAMFGWSDVGNWLTAAELLPCDAQANRVAGNAVLEHASRNMIVSASTSPLIVAGISDCVIVHGPLGTLVCHKSHVERLKALVGRLEAKRDVGI